MKMHCSWIVTLALAVAPAAAQPDAPPRFGQLAEVKFAAGTQMLVADTERQLGEVVKWAKENPEGTLVIEGYADRRGSARASLDVSTKRADTIVARLVALDVPREQMVVAGFGASTMGRRVVVWSTRGSYESIEKRLRARGAKTVQTSQAMASVTAPAVRVAASERFRGALRTATR